MFRTIAIAAILIAAPAGAAEQGAAASREAAAGTIRLELNRLAPADNGGCIVTFVAENTLGDLDRLAYQTVMFNGEGLVERMAVFDFGKLRAGKTVVRQFSLPRLGCASLSRILVNEAPQCVGSGIAPQACIERLSTANRTDKVFGS